MRKISKFEALINGGVLLLSLILSLGLAEVAVRLFIPVRDLGPSFTVYDPVLGKRLKASFSAERVTPEFRMRLSTNSLGFRGPELKGGPQGSIVFLGDSFTLGYGVSDGEEYPARIAAELRRRHGDTAPPVVNAGIGDSGNGFWVKFLRTEAAALKPRLVVMQLLDNDFADNVSEKLFALGPDGSLRGLSVPPPGAMRRLQALIEAIPGLPYSHLVGLMRQLRGPTFEPLDKGASGPARSDGPNAEDELTLRIVQEAISICSSQGWSMLGLLVGIPAAREAALKDLFARQGIPLITVPGKAQRPDLYYEIDGHWRAPGHAYAAERVLMALTTLDIGSRQPTLGTR